ncbi:MAG TPA: hypothetical protein VMH81_33165 [Bryobacteraceae bacterium]|nr:hypothetical protein [Bryobacteraceae bacterium]
MPELVRAMLIWWERRRRFREEWHFHLSRAASDWESLGLSPGEARRMATRRLGSRQAQRREALRELGADTRGLFALLPIRRIRRSPWFVITVLAALITLTLAVNPARRQVIRTLYYLLPLSGSAPAARLLPLSRSGTVPAGFARLTLWAFLATGFARIAARLAQGGGWRISVYALAV